MFTTLKLTQKAALLVLFACTNVYGAPSILFTDLISGPDTGIGDNLGSGVIVTIWGQNLGSSQGNSSVTYTDSTNTKRNAAHVYYWKNADGSLPSGPANLYESHKMQEIAFSIPDSAVGAGTIYVTVNGVDSNTLPFTVRAGKIYHVKSTGNDSSGDGSFSKPWLTVAKGDSGVNAGDTLYIHDVDSGSPTTQRAIYINRGFKATEADQFAYVAYPGTRPTTMGAEGVHMYLTSGIVTSKLQVFASNCDSVGKNCKYTDTRGILPSAWGRVIGNEITDQPGGCANGWAGAISANKSKVEGAKLFGNYIHDYSCPEATKFHHTTYMSIRDTNDPSIVAWEWGWNYLRDNDAKNGIHNYDEDLKGNNACGDLKTDLLIHDNVIVNQAGAGITVMSICGWSQDSYIYNNVLINTGLISSTTCTSGCGFTGSGIKIGDGLGDVYIYNNTVYNWDQGDIPNIATAAACIAVANGGLDGFIDVRNNICYSDKTKYFTGYHSGAQQKLSTLQGGNNIWYYPGVTAGDVPGWDKTAIYTDPKIDASKAPFLSLSVGSPAIGKAIATPVALNYDLYHELREGSFDIGAFEISNNPKPPSNVTAK